MINYSKSEFAEKDLNLITADTKYGTVFVDFTDHTACPLDKFITEICLLLLSGGMYN